MRFICLFLLLCLCGLTSGAGNVNAGQAGAIVTVEGPEIFSGTYDVFGTNRNGSKYTGTAVIAVSGNKVEMSWLISSGQTYHGKGSIKANGRIVVDFGGRYPIIYKVGPDGSLSGKWDNGRASETLIPK